MRFINTILACLFIIFFCSCNDDVSLNDIDRDYVDAKFVLSIEGKPMLSDLGKLSVNESANGVYAVQVYKKSEKDGLQAYGYGLFDDLSKLSLQLENNSSYVVEMSFVKDGKNIVATTSSGGYQKPFSIYRKSGGTSVSNVMVLSSSNYFSGLSVGKTVLVDGNEYEIPVSDRYYGVSDVVECKSSNVSFSVNLKRVVFALNISAKNQSSGVVLVQVLGSPVMSVEHGQEKEFIYTFKGALSPALDSKWIQDDYKEDIVVNMWYDADGFGSYQDLGTQNVSVQRRYSYTIEMTAQQGSYNSKFTISMESDVLIDSGNTINF